MDVSDILKQHNDKNSTQVLSRPTPVHTDPALLAAFDNLPIDHEQYNQDIEQHLIQLTLSSTHALISALFTLPTNPSPSGPISQIPPPTTLLPREKPLPKPKPLTKWERFAKERGISHKKKEREVWDEEKQEWVSRWGYKGKNKQDEEQWLHEVKAGEDADQDPAKTARAERKARTAKNQKQQTANLAAAAKQSTAVVADSQEARKSARESRKSELNRSMLITKTSTASLGKFDQKIEGEPKAKGVKRRFEATVQGDYGDEKQRALGVLKRVERGEREGKRSKKGGEGEEGGLNVRKAVRFSGGAEKQKIKTTGKKGKRK
ncbi:uncharacterized protein L203_100827 [Cryptococcus depauperatus CBS 7841]|uniref:Ribosome biogenesis regulatory protein n=1 Tax=Cryptococcus depauperatus CBS 7841 TaxID=1295531 RepID=A0A1E3IXK4_9TREE|nr:hypothetical protein L203_00618 [Cryptococcus depauperatus CBS 7841]